MFVSHISECSISEIRSKCWNNNFDSISPSVCPKLCWRDSLWPLYVCVYVCVCVCVRVHVCMCT